MPPEVHLVSGNRSEALRLAPVALAMRAAGLLDPVLVTSGERPATVTRTLAAFDLAPDVTLPVVRGAEEAGALLSGLLTQFAQLWHVRPPAAVLVHGDTPTSLAAALTAYWREIPVVHLEAGVRGDDPATPLPTEPEHRLITQLARLHLAPTALSAMNLLDENVATGDLLISGGTAVDATLAVAARNQPFEDAAVAAQRDRTKRLVLALLHQPQSCGEPLERILAGVTEIVRRYPDVQAVLSSSPDPAVRARIEYVLTGLDRLTSTGPLSYPDRCRLLAEAYLVVTDSDVVQYEAPSFGVPALLLTAAKQGALEHDGAQAVGADPAALVAAAASALLDSRVRRDSTTAGGNPYGDGQAARRAAQATAALLGLAEHPEPMPHLSPAGAGTFGAAV